MIVDEYYVALLTKGRHVSSYRYRNKTIHVLLTILIMITSEIKAIYTV